MLDLSHTVYPDLDTTQAFTYLGLNAADRRVALIARPPRSSGAFAT